MANPMPTIPLPVPTCHGAPFGPDAPYAHVGVAAHPHFGHALYATKAVDAGDYVYAEGPCATLSIQEVRTPSVWR